MLSYHSLPELDDDLQRQLPRKSVIDLEEADLKEADLREMQGLSCGLLITARNWESAYRDKALACEAAIPTAPY